MTELDNCAIYEKKLSGICDANDLTYRFDYNRYPITLTIRPCSGMDSQMSMLESSAADEGQYTSPDAAIIFAYKDGELTYRTSKTFTISDALFGKIKNLFRKMHTLYCQSVHRFCAENNARLPEVVDPMDTDDEPGDYPDYENEPDDFDDEADEEEADDGMIGETA